uniref:Alcohol dehydrogenase 1 n=1 Tax=Ganoderma boninense TaxID=34458 RepID=A0A5K1JTJ5_9APHY|nr:Alcohol dehydrogenase 1 [Ganoderma boninense]
MSTQKAFMLPEKHGEWKLTEIAIPSPGPTDVLVKVVAAGLNPIDWKNKDYNIIPTSFPFISGTDGSGVVETVGSEVKTFAKGDKVLFQGNFGNEGATFQQYAIVPADLLAKVPENLTLDQAASIPLALATVTTGIWVHTPNALSVSIPAPWEAGGETQNAGKPILVFGGTSTVGQFAIQAARLNKFAPIITTASPHNAARLTALGATHVLDRALSPAALSAAIASAAGGAPIGLVYDAISGADTQAVGYAALAPGGSLITTLPPAVPAESLKADRKIVNVYGSLYLPGNRAFGKELFTCGRVCERALTGLFGIWRG